MNKLFALLKDRNIALVLLDKPWMITAYTQTADFGYIRWQGDRKRVAGNSGEQEVERSNELRIWSEKIKMFLEQEIEIFGYFSKFFSGHPPTDAAQMLRFIRS